MYCERCEAFIPDDSKFCPECGKEQIPVSEPAVLRCPDCGAELEPDSLFCENCGRKLGVHPAQRSTGSTAPERPRVSAVPPVPPAPPVHSERQRIPDIPPAPPAPPKRPREASIPRAPQIPARETISQSGSKPKKKSGCGTVVLLILVLLVLAAGYYVWKVYDGDPNELISRVFSGIRPTAESVLTKIPETISDITTKIPETISDITSKPTATSAFVDIRPAATIDPVTQPTAPVSRITAPTSIPKPADRKAYDARNYSTSEMSRLQDFLWVTQDIVKGSLPPDHVRLTDFDELLGGWKAYIIDDLNGQYGSGIERLCSVNFTKDANGNGMTFTWVYVHNTKTDEGNTDYTPPTTFYGEMQNGRFYGLGTGSIDMTAFYVLNGHEYAVGQLHWPDTAIGTVFLVRP